MALPTTRNTSYVAGVTPVRAHDLNDIQDKIIALHTDVEAVYAERWINKLPIGYASEGAYTVLQDDAVIGGGVSATVVNVPFELVPGTRIKRCRARARVFGGAVAMQVVFYHWNGNSNFAETGDPLASTLLATLTAPVAAGSNALITYESGALDFPVVAMGSVYARIAMSNESQICGPISLLVQTPNP